MSLSVLCAPHETSAMARKRHSRPTRPAAGAWRTRARSARSSVALGAVKPSILDALDERGQPRHRQLRPATLLAVPKGGQVPPHLNTLTGIGVARLAPHHSQLLHQISNQFTTVTL